MNPYDAPVGVEDATGPRGRPHTLDLRSLPPLGRDISFWGMTLTQFLGAFNDNLFKQLMLLLAVPVGLAAVTEEDQQGLATAVFSLPFVLFSGYAGFLSDRYSKQLVIILSKVAEIVAMLLGMVAFAMYAISGYPGLLAVLFLMGAQSAFFGPAKYGILPEMLREEDLPRANGIIVMTTFLAIIFGTASAGVLGDLALEGDRASPDRLWIGSMVCVAIAVAGTATSFLVRRVPPANPGLRFELSALTVPPDVRRMLRNDRPLVLALLASCMFWLVGGIVVPAINSLGLAQLGLNNFKTSLMVSAVGVGIAIGAVAAGRLSHGRVDFRIVRAGSWGIVAFLLLLSISRAGGAHLLGFGGSLAALILLGMSAGLFAIPIQVFLQARPPQGLKGRMIAVMNQANFIAIVLSGVTYSLFDRIVDGLVWPRSTIFAMIALLMLPVALFYRPQEARS